jgi:hypothetical protein
MGKRILARSEHVPISKTARGLTAYREQGVHSASRSARTRWGAIGGSRAGSSESVRVAAVERSMSDRLLTRIIHDGSSRKRAAAYPHLQQKLHEYCGLGQRFEM